MEENKILREKIGKKIIPLNDNQKVQLARDFQDFHLSFLSFPVSTHMLNSRQIDNF